MDPAASHPLPDVGSFSYSWPTSKPERRPEERLDHADVVARFIGTDPASASQCSFDFRLSPPQQTADADQMFLDGLLLPLQLASRHGQEGGDSGSWGPVLVRSLSLDSSQRMVASGRDQQAAPSTPAGVAELFASRWSPRRGDPREGRRAQGEHAQAAVFPEMREAAQVDVVQVLGALVSEDSEMHLE